MIVSMTTIPSRIPHIEPVVQSLYGQAPVLLSVATYCHRTGDTMDVLPRWVKRYPDLLIKAITDDRGSIEKILQPLELKLSKEVITVDDDVIYPPEFIPTIESYRALYPKSCLCFRGKVKDSPAYATCSLVKGTQITQVKPVDIVTGTWGAYYKREWFDMETFSEYMNPDLKTVDDMVISRYLSDQKIDRYCLPIQSMQPVPEIHTIDALWHINRRNPYNDQGMEGI